MDFCSISDLLEQNTYPGRGIILGRSTCGNFGIAAYFIMGRSENSRNRIFEKTGEGIRTKAFDESLVSDPSLIIYHPVRTFEHNFIVTNGDQTDTVFSALSRGESYISALRTRTFEPDGPIFTPRISGVMHSKTGDYCLSVLKSLEGDDATACRFFYEYESPKNGTGHFIHTYAQNGSPPPSFSGEPKGIDLGFGSAEEMAHSLWASLNGENKISLYVAFINLKNNEVSDIIINKNA